MPGRKELPLIISDRINAVDHCLISRKYTRGVAVGFAFAEIGQIKIRQQIVETALCLCNQRIAVSKKQNMLYPAMLQQNIAQLNDRASLTRTGRHNQQCLAAIAIVEIIADSFDRLFLIVATGNIAVDVNMRQTGSERLKIEQLFQITLGVNKRNPAFRIVVVNDACFKSISQEHDRATAISLLKQVSIEFCLLSTDRNIHASLFGFDDRQRSAVITIKDIISKPDTGCVGHSCQFHFIEPVFIFDPAHILQHSININLASFELRNLHWLRDIRRLLFCTQCSEFAFQGSVFLHQLFQIDIRDSRRWCNWLWGGCNIQFMVKFIIEAMFIAVMIHYKLQKAPEVVQAQLCLFSADIFAFVNSTIPQPANKIHLLPKLIVTDKFPEITILEQCVQRCLIRHRERLINGVHPFYRKFHRLTATDD